MAHGCAQTKFRVLLTIALASTFGAWLSAYTALAAAGNTPATHANTARPILQLVTSGPLGLDVRVPALAAGDQSQRTLTLQDPGPQPIARIALTITTPGSSPLVTDPHNAVQVQVDACSTTWQATTKLTLRCSGTQTPLLTWQPITHTSTTYIGGLAAHGSTWLRITTRLPETATAASEGAATQIKYAFTAS
jgi:spore coat-associated protein N